MPGSADFIQRTVHALEMGGLAIWIRRLLVTTVAIVLAVGYLIWPLPFRGLATSDAMDQAQIARAIARGEGWSTRFARPLGIAQLKAHGKNVEQNIWLDTYNAPLPPLVNALPLLLVKGYWQMGTTDLVATGDRAIAVMSMLLFLLSIVVLFFLARRLFDQRLAVLVCALVLFGDIFWEYSTSGLPQMLLLFLFNCTLYALVRAVQAEYGGGQPVPSQIEPAEPASPDAPDAGQGRSPLVWLAAAGLGFGLLALGHALTIWMFIGALIFCVLFFKRRGRTAAVLLGVFALVYVPWLIRNYIVSGNPGGLAIFSILDGVRYNLAGWMRRTDFDTAGLGIGPFRTKIISNFLSETGHILAHFGWSVVALAFFVALLHRFKRPETAAVRLLVLAMWLGAVLGMALYGISEEQGFAANELHLLFIPIMTCYGLAFLLVQWNRLELNIPFARPAFVAFLFLLCTFPMINALVLSSRRPRIVWPPYVPPYIAVLNKWMKPDEVVASDMPWAIAWYADRRSVWVPETIKEMIELSDYRVLGGPINGLYLTPISGASNTLRDVVKGEYKDWAPFIERTVNLQKSPLPLKWPTLLGLDNECVFFSDHDRSERKQK